MTLPEPLYPGRWHSKDRTFGLHYDLHASETDTELGLRAIPEELVPLIKLADPEFVQTDCKGHPGYTSWFSQTPEASVPPQLKADALQGWREATRQLNLPLHCHYSGIWDRAAGAKHPEWTRVDRNGRHAGSLTGKARPTALPEWMCPRSEYLSRLMIPQLVELIDRYDVNGFWIDGDLWASEPCYCKRCRDEFTARTGIAEPPRNPGETNWPAWISFSLDSFYEYVRRYCEAVHQHKPGVLVCSNWLQTFRNPGPPIAPTDWISGDNSWVWGLDGSRCEARFISTRGKPWDIMLWSFYCSHGMGKPGSPWTFKPVQMLQQEAAITLAMGGSVQIYENPGSVRNGQLIPWRMKHIGEVGDFVKVRRSLCQDTQTIGQIAVLHSEHHVRQHMERNLMWGVDTKPVQGAVFSLLENHYNVDILDEWALLQRLNEFPVIVVPEQDDLSDEMVQALKQFVSTGGLLIVSGVKALNRFGSNFLGVRRRKLQKNATFHIPAGQSAVPVFSSRWLMVEPTKARAFGQLGNSDLTTERLLEYPVWTLNQVKKGSVAWIPFEVFRFFEHNRYPLVRQFIGELAQKIIGKLPIRVTAPTCIDTIIRRKGKQILVHLINRSSGLPNVPSSGAVDEIPPVGPILIEIETSASQVKITQAFESISLSWESKQVNGKKLLTITLDRVFIHAAIVVEEG